MEKVQEKGLGFFVSPSEAIAEHGVWRTEAYGRTYAFPYTPAFHLPFAALGLPYDTLLAGHEADRGRALGRCRWCCSGRWRGAWAPRPRARS